MEKDQIIMDKAVLNKDSKKSTLEVLLGTVAVIGGTTVMVGATVLPEITGYVKYIAQVSGGLIMTGGTASILKGIWDCSKIIRNLYNGNKILSGSKYK